MQKFKVRIKFIVDLAKFYVISGKIFHGMVPQIKVFCILFYTIGKIFSLEKLMGRLVAVNFDDISAI